MKAILLIILLSLTACDEETEYCSTNEIYHSATGLCFYAIDYDKSRDVSDVRAWLIPCEVKYVVSACNIASEYRDDYRMLHQSEVETIYNIDLNRRIVGKFDTSLDSLWVGDYPSFNPGLDPAGMYLTFWLEGTYGDYYQFELHENRYHLNYYPEFRAYTFCVRDAD